MLIERLSNQKLLGSTLTRPEDVVAWLGAIQSQDYPGAKWAVSLRARGLTDHAIEQAFNEGRILRTHLLRPTWHFVTPADIAWMLALNAPRLLRLNRVYAKVHGLDERIIKRSRDALERALAGGVSLTRAEIAAVLQKARVQARGQRLAHLLFDLEQQAVICSGPQRGKQFTYALFCERVPRASPVPRDEALARLAARYFQSHGPATVKDFSWWSGLTMKDAREAVAAAGVTPLAQPPTLQSVSNAHYLLPNYDEYLIAYRDRGAVIDPVRARNLGVFTTRELPHQLILDGRVAGSWRRIAERGTHHIEIWPYQRLTRAQQSAIRQQVERYASFAGVPRVDVRIR